MIVFISGSKISKAPDVKDLTTKICSARLHLGSDNCFWSNPASRGPFRPDCAKIIPDFFSYLIGKIAEWQGIKLSEVNYEQLGSLCTTLAIEFGTARNPSLRPFWNETATEWGSKFIPSTDVHESLAELCDLSLVWMRQVLASELKLKTDWSSPAIKFLQRMPIATDSWAAITLNHDLVLEDAFREIGQKVETGFGQSEDSSPFSPDLIRNPQFPLLIKPHGSIDWFRDKNLGKIVRQNTTKPHDLWPFASRAPEINLGTFNKLEDYSSGIYPYLFAAIDRALERATGIIVSGYGFKDDGINSRIFNELLYRQDTKILVIHPIPGDLLSSASAFAKYHISRLGNSNRLIWAKCKFENTTNSAAQEVLDRFVSEHSN